MLTTDARQTDFPKLMSMTYLNTAAEGLPPLSVAKALDEYYEDKSIGMDGRDLHFAKWEAAKKEVAGFFSLTPDEVSICSCASEAYNLAAKALQLSEGDEVIINDLDFPAGTTPWLQPGCSARVKLWQASEGRLRVDRLSRILRERDDTLAVLAGDDLAAFADGAQVLNDDLAPVDQLLTPYVVER